MRRKIIIAIDGYASCGKSTLARDLARRFGYRYIDTGAMYRAVTWYFLCHGVDHQDPAQVAQALHDIHLDFTYDKQGQQHILLNKMNIESEIRSPEISNAVSPVSTVKEVRDFLVAQQKRMGREGGIVMDGRDIGTVVFPDAEIKLFVTSNIDVRVQRRYQELKEKGMEVLPEEVRENLQQRDHIDTTRKESPLRKAEDAIIIDNSYMTMEEQLELACRYAEEAQEKV